MQFITFVPLGSTFSLVGETSLSLTYYKYTLISPLHADTAFMFIIGGLLTVKVLQSRHPDINAYAFLAFFCFAIVIFLTMIGIVSDICTLLQNTSFAAPLSSQYFSRLNPESTRVVLFLVLITAAVIFFTSFYNHHQLTKLWTNFKGIDTQKPLMPFLLVLNVADELKHFCACFSNKEGEHCLCMPKNSK